MRVCPICGKQTDKSLEAAPGVYQHRCSDVFLRRRDAANRAAVLEPRGSVNVPASIPGDDTGLWHNIIRALEEC